jgi:AcrR family transcriptional regulator
LYYYFPNKGALFEEVLAFHVDRLKQRLEAAAYQGKGHRDRVEKMLLAYSDHVSESRSPLFLLRYRSEKETQIEKEDIHQQHARHVTAMMQPFEDELHLAIEAGGLRRVPGGVSPASLLLGLFHGLVQHRRTRQQFDIRSTDVALIIDIFWRGLSNPVKSDGNCDPS